jgi:CubicO group peptidase (beta-lactamase class C family)
VTSTRAAIDSVMADYARPGVPGASVLIRRHGQTVLATSYGSADLEAKVAATPTTNYRLASLTKQFTAAAIELLVHDGKLRYDERLTDIFPGFPDYGRAITVRHLLQHTSGLLDYEDFVPDSSPIQVHDRDVLDTMRRQDHGMFPPGSQYHYSNTGYALLAMIVERRSGEGFARFLQERIFRPLRMTQTVAYEAGVSEVSNRAWGYTADGSGFRRTDQSPTSAVLGDGGIYTSVNDLARWDEALRKALLVDSSTLEQAMSTPLLADGTRSEYGFGWFVGESEGRRRQYHHGESVGFTNAIERYPAEELTVVVLTNRTGGEPWTLAHRIALLALQGGFGDARAAPENR